MASPGPKRSLSYKGSVSSRGSQSSTSGPRDSVWDPDLRCLVGESKVSREVTAKRAIRNARLLFEASAQSQSPSKDFTCILITEKGIIWSKWKITLRGFTSGTAPVPQPQEEAMSFTDFKCNDALMVNKHSNDLNTIPLTLTPEMRFTSLIRTIQGWPD